MSLPHRPEAEARFTGAVSFPNSDDARAFNAAVNDFLESSSKVFFEIEKNVMYPHTCLGHAKRLLGLSENFELNAIYFEFKESQERCKRGFAELKGNVDDLEKVLLEPRPSVNRWSLIQADKINLAVKGILGCLKNLIDYNENDVIVVVAQNIQLCFKATNNLEGATSHLPKHKQNLRNVTDGLKDQVSNRATIVKDNDVVQRLENLRRKLDPAVDNVLERGTTNDFEELRKLLHEAEALFRPVFSEGDFSYKDVDSKAFNSAIDDLLDSIRTQSGPGIRDNAGRLGAQAKALNDAGQALKEQTKALVAAAADALKNKDSEEAQKRLEKLMADAKIQAEELQKRQERENQRRQQLMKASAGVGLAIDNMQYNLGDYRSKVKHEMNPALENKMQQEENDRLRKLNSNN